MRPLRVRWARFGKSDPRWYVHVPAGGFCLSAFLVVRDPHGAVLLGRPRPHPAWAEKGCLPAWRVRQVIEGGEWILPSSHLLMEETPLHAGQRLCRDWAGLRGARPRLIAVDSSTFPGGHWTGSGRSRYRIRHWAMGFVFEVRTDSPAPTAPWWEETKFVPVPELRKTRIGRGHRDLIRYALPGGGRSVQEGRESPLPATRSDA